MDTNTVTQSKPNGAMVKTSVAFPQELWRRVRLAAVEHDTTAQQICIDGAELALKRIAKQK